MQEHPALEEFAREPQDLHVPHHPVLVPLIYITATVLEGDADILLLQ